MAKKIGKKNMASFARENGGMLNFPGREPIPRWRVVSDYVVCPILGIVLTFVFSSQILSASSPWIYTVLFGLVSLVCFLVAHFNQSQAVRYSGFALCAYFAFTALFCLAMILLF